LEKRITTKPFDKTKNTASEVIEPTSEVDAVAGKVEKEENLIGRPANDESTADHQ